MDATVTGFVLLLKFTTTTKGKMIEHTDIGGGVHVSTGPFEELMQDQSRREKEANAQLMPEQIAMRDSIDAHQYWIHLRPGLEFPIFGDAWSLKVQAENDRQFYPSVMTKEEKAEYKDSRDAYADSRQRGYIFGRAYSVVEPRGELGSTHVAEMWPISEAAFDEATAANWQPDSENCPTLRKELNNAKSIWAVRMQERIKQQRKEK